MPDARDVRVEINQVSDQQDHWVKVKWAVGINSHRPYTVKLDRLRECSKRTRAALQDLIEAARTKEQSKYPLLIRKLAEQGQELYKSLFFGISQHDKEDAERARGWVNEKLVPGQDTITFLVPSRIHIPFPGG